MNQDFNMHDEDHEALISSSLNLMVYQNKVGSELRYTICLAECACEHKLCFRKQYPF